LADPQRTIYLQNGHLSTIDREQVRESPPAKTDVVITKSLRQPAIAE